MLYELLAHNRVALLKVNPTQEPLVPVFERALAPLIEPGFVRIVRGGADVGAYLTGTRASRTCTSPARHRRSTRSCGAVGGRGRRRRTRGAENRRS